jgi:hypothetical protein
MADILHRVAIKSLSLNTSKALITREDLTLVRGVVPVSPRTFGLSPCNMGT